MSIRKPLRWSSSLLMPHFQKGLDQEHMQYRKTTGKFIDYQDFHIAKYVETADQNSKRLR